LDLVVSDFESLSHGELVALARAQAVRIDAQAAVIARQDAQITVLSTQLPELMEKFEQQAEELARPRHLLSRNSSNSSMPSSKDDDPGRTPLHRSPRLTPRQPTTNPVTGRHHTPKSITQRAPAECLRQKGKLEKK
jgi:hypothetical protein